jgi:hypothetical protein
MRWLFNLVAVLDTQQDERGVLKKTTLALEDAE